MRETLANAGHVIDPAGGWRAGRIVRKARAFSHADFARRERDR